MTLTLISTPFISCSHYQCRNKNTITNYSRSTAIMARKILCEYHEKCRITQYNYFIVVYYYSLMCHMTIEYVSYCVIWIFSFNETPGILKVVLLSFAILYKAIIPYLLYDTVLTQWYWVPHICAYVCICVYIYMCMYMYIYVYICIYVYVCMYMYACVCVYIYAYICMRVWARSPSV